VANAAMPRMGEKLIEMGAINDDHLKLALRKQKIDHILLGKTLIDLNFVDEETISSLLATKSTANYLDIHTVDFDTDAIALIPMSMAAQHTMIPFKADRNIEIRVSTLRSIYGERVVMRLLDKDDISADMGACKFPRPMFSST